MRLSKIIVLGLLIWLQNPSDAQIGSALSFDGSNDFVSVPNSNNLQVGGSNFNVEFWVRQTLVSRNFRYAVAKDHNITNNQYNLVAKK